jgi:hypothetical protein
MEKVLLDQISEVLTSPKYLPCISILMPFDPKMGLKKELDYKLKTASDKIERELTANYPVEKSSSIIKTLHKVISELNYFTHKKSIAIFISPLIQKVYYLDMPIEEKIIIDESFEIRDLIYSKKEIQKYLLVVLSNKWTKIFLGNCADFVKITSNVPDNIEAYKNDIGEKIANFSDENKRKEILLDKFLMHTDDGLSQLYNAYKLPLFVMGTSKTIGHFNALTRNKKHIVDYIHGSFEEKTESELRELMKPHITDWKKINQKRLLNQIEDANSQKKLSQGISEVWKAASQKKGKLLIVENNYVFPAQQSASPEIIFKKDDFVKNAFYIKDAVDDIIEKVIASGGDVEFVDPGMLKDFNKIVLIEYFASK